MEKVEFRNSQGLKVVGALDLPSGEGPFPTVLTLHGFGGTKESNQEWADILNPLGIATLRIDFQGSGESDGKYEDKTITGFIDDAQNALDYLYSLPQVDSKKVGIAGHSMGAVIAILLASRDPRITSLVASVPAVKEGEVIANLYDSEDFAQAPAKGYVELRKSGEKERLNYAFFEDARKYDLTQEAKIISHKFLVIGAGKDDVVPFEQIKEFCNQVQNARLLTLPNSDHNLEQDWPIAEKAIKEWFENWLKQESR